MDLPPVAGRQPNEYLLLFRGAVGAALIALGLSHFFGRGINFHFLSPLGRRFTSTQGLGQTKGLFTYGFGYNAIGIGCGGPIMAGLGVFAFSAGASLQPSWPSASTQRQWRPSWSSYLC